ncbi:MAG: TIGR00304 family protein [Thaumarchaeota archaeon]|nr:MAG: TIGR00304 family protein [Nitrososphaerota archaeon]
MERLPTPSDISPLLLLVGAFLIILGLFLIFLGFAPAEKIEGGGLIMVGPFPIIFHGEASPMTILLILLLPRIVFIALALYFLQFARRLEEGGQGS